MNYDFDCHVDRRNIGSMKWDAPGRFHKDEEILPMWVADMDFSSPPEVVEAIRRRAEHGTYGYNMRPLSLDQAVLDWMRVRHGWEVQKEWLTYTPGVVPAINLAILALTQPGDRILIQSPVYHPFFSAVEANGRQIALNQLRLLNGRYTMDIEGLTKLMDRRVRMVVLCSPHNPVGRVWTREELQTLGDFCVKNHIVIVSDEIHSDLILNGRRHLPTAMISDSIAQQTITLTAASKTFNLAGLVTSVAIISNADLMARFNIAMEKIGMGHPHLNIFGGVATDAAYRYGGPWLDSLLRYLEGNVDFIDDYLKTNIPKVKLIRPEGTYLAWLDFRQVGLDDKALQELMLKKAKVLLSDGISFGPGGSGFQRLNFGCPRAQLAEGLQRIARAVNGLS